jgi:hypothetical protein
MLHDFLNIDKSPVIALSKKGLAKASFAVTIGMVSLAAGTGLLPITVAGVSNTQVASAQWRPNNPGVYACNAYANNNCLIYASSVSTWVGNIAGNECRRRHGQSALAQRTFVPYIFACLVPAKTA